MRSLILAGATEHEGFLQHLRLLEGAFKLSAKDLRSQVVREACFTLGYEAILSYHFFFQSLLGYLFNIVFKSDIDYQNQLVYSQLVGCHLLDVHQSKTHFNSRPIYHKFSPTGISSYSASCFISNIIGIQL